MSNVSTLPDRPATKALLLDADGVIQYPRSGWLIDMERLGGLGFVKEVFALEETTLTGRVDLRELIDDVLQRRGRSCSPEDILGIWHEIEPDERMLSLIRRVRQTGLTTVLATNQQSYRGGHMQREMNYDEFFDAAFYSFEVGLAKPDPAYFWHILDSLELEPAEVVFVDDKPENVAGARSIGIRAEVFRWTDTFGDLRSRLRHQGVPGL